MLVLREVERDQDQQQNGWVCPKCQISIAPHMEVCPQCEQTKMKENNIPSNKQILMG
jgi:rubrerythrin